MTFGLPTCTGCWLFQDQGGCTSLITIVCVYIYIYIYTCIMLYIYIYIHIYIYYVLCIIYTYNPQQGCIRFYTRLYHRTTLYHNIDCTSLWRHTTRRRAIRSNAARRSPDGCFCFWPNNPFGILRCPFLSGPVVPPGVASYRLAHGMSGFSTRQVGSADYIFQRVSAVPGAGAPVLVMVYEISYCSVLYYPVLYWTVLTIPYCTTLSYPILILILGEHKPGRIKPGRIKRAALSLQNPN